MEHQDADVFRHAEFHAGSGFGLSPIITGIPSTKGRMRANITQNPVPKRSIGTQTRMLAHADSYAELRRVAYQKEA